MKLMSLRSLHVLAALLLASHVAASAQTSTASSSGEARVIISLKSGSSLMRAQAVIDGPNAAPHHAQALSARHGLALSDGRAIDARTQVVRAQGLSSEQLAAKLRQDSEVAYAVVDYRRYAHSAPNDPRYASGQVLTTPAVGQWYLHAPTGTLVSAINAEGAWTKATGANVVVAMLDTGVRFDHPDLNAKLYPGYDFISTPSTSHDGDGYDASPSDPGDWVAPADATRIGGGCEVGNSTWHGTQTAGVVGAATNNGIGIAGAGGDVMILPLRVLGQCGGNDSDIIAAMRWAAGLSVADVPSINTHPAKVINLSLGSGDPCTSAYTQAISEVNHAGSMVVVSAGNDGLAVNAPANCPGAVAVGGLHHAGVKASYSSLGNEVALSAPGGDCPSSSPNSGCLYPIPTTINDGATTAQTNTYSDGGIVSIASLGTSFSAPLVSGAAALVWSAQPGLSPMQVLNVLKASARAFPTTGGNFGLSACTAPGVVEQGDCYCTTATCGAGMLNANAAVTLALAGSTPLVPVISYDASAASPDTPFTLDSARSVFPPGRALAQVSWSVVSGTVTNTSSPNGQTFSLQGPAGNVTVRLTLTDDATPTPDTKTRDITIVIGGPATFVDPPVTAPAQPTRSGGGALGPVWLALLLAAVLALWPQRQRLQPKPIRIRR